MAFGELIKSQVLTEYKADTSQMRRELKRLSSEQKKHAKEQLERAEEENRALDEKIAMWGKVAAGIGGAVLAYKAVTEAAEFYAKRSRLVAASAGADIGKLQNAAKGLVTQTRLLELSAAAMNGTFKLSQKQLETVVRGAVALRAEGKDLTRTLERVQQAVTEGTVEPLKELGLVIKGSENDTQEGLNAAIKALGAEADKMKGKMVGAGDGVEQAQVQMADAFDDIKEAAGELAIALTPIVQAIADMATEIARVIRLVKELGDNELIRWGQSFVSAIQGRGGLLSGAVGDVTGMAGTGPRRRLLRSGTSERAPIRSGGGAEADAIIAAEKARRDAAIAARNAELERIKAMAAAKKAFEQASKKGGGGPGFVLQGTQVMREGMQLSSGSIEIASTSLSREGRGPMQMGTGSGFDPQTAAIREAMQAAELARKGSILSSIFGTPAEIEATAAAYEMLGSTFSGLTNVAATALGAIIDGNGGVIEATKRATAEALKTMSIDMGIRAIRELAMGTAMLFINPAQSGAHFKAAGMFGVGATAAGLAANKMGVGSIGAPVAAGGGAGATAGAAGVGSSRGAQGPQSSSQLFLLGGDFSELPPGQREAIFRRKARRAGMTFEGDAVING